MRESSLGTWYASRRPATRYAECARRERERPMASQYLYRIQPIREGLLTESTPDEGRAVNEHFRYLQRLTEEGVVLLAGRTLNTDPSSFGLVIFEAESEEAARELMQNDPAVQASVFRAELFPCHVALVSAGILPH